MKRLIIGAVAGLMLAGCGATGLGPGASPSPSPTPSGGAAVSVTEKDRAVTLGVGQRLLVVLHAQPNMRPWSVPKSSDPSVLMPVVNPAASAVVGVTMGAFQAVAPGVAEVTSFGAPDCIAGQACPMYAIAYTLQVTVKA
jgi:hypothetical protein